MSIEKKQVLVDEKMLRHEITYLGKTEDNKYKIQVDEDKFLAEALNIVGLGRVIRGNINGSDFYILVSESGEQASFIIDRVNVDSGEVLAEDVNLNGIVNFYFDQKVKPEVVAKRRSGIMSSLSIWTAVNLVLMFVKIPIYFPYSLFLSTTLAQVSKTSVSPASEIFLVVSFLPIAIFVLLYYISAESIVPRIVGFVIFVVDTLILLMVVAVSGDNSLIFDIILHAWAIYSFIKELMWYSKLPKEVK